MLYFQSFQDVKKKSYLADITFRLKTSKLLLALLFDTFIKILGGQLGLEMLTDLPKEIFETDIVVTE